MRKIKVRRKVAQNPLDKVREKLKVELKKEMEEEFKKESISLQAALEVKEQRLAASALVVKELQKHLRKLQKDNRLESVQLGRWRKVFPFAVDVAAEFLEDLCSLADAGDVELFELLREYGIRVKTRRKRNG